MSESQQQVRVIKTRGRGRDALIEIDGRQLVVTDAFSPPGNAAARDVPLSGARLFGTVDEGRESVRDAVRVNPDKITKIVSRGVGLWWAHGRIEAVRPFEMNCGSVPVTIQNLTDDDPSWIHHYMTAPLNRLELTGRLGAEDERGNLLLPELPPLEPEVESEAAVLRERAAERNADPPPALASSPDDGFDVQKHYTMRQLLMLMTAATVVLGLLRLLPASLGTSVVGLVVLVAMFFATDRRSTPAIIRLAWWMLLAIYLISAVITVGGMLG